MPEHPGSTLVGRHSPRFAGLHSGFCLSEFIGGTSRRARLDALGRGGPAAPGRPSWRNWR